VHFYPSIGVFDGHLKQSQEGGGREIENRSGHGKQVSTNGLTERGDATVSSGSIVLKGLLSCTQCKVDKAPNPPFGSNRVLQRYSTPLAVDGIAQDHTRTSLLSGCIRVILASLEHDIKY